MATVTNVILRDSLDERIVNGVETVTFFHPMTGQKMEVELGEANRKHFGNHLEKLQKYFDAAVVVEQPSPAKKTAAVKNSDKAKVRQWAKENGFNIGDRGRISAEIMTAYTAAHEVVSEKDAEVIATIENGEVTELSDTDQAEGETQVVDEPSEVELDDDSDILAMLAEIDAETGGNFTAEQVAERLDESNDNE